MSNFQEQEMYAALIIIKNKDKIRERLSEANIPFTELVPGSFDIQCVDESQRKMAMAIIDAVFLEQCHEKLPE